MTTNQTIDGVPRELVEWMANSGELLELLGLCSGELRALLDAPAVEVRDKCGVQMVDCPECSHQWDHFFECGNGPANPKPTGLSQGWNLTRKHDGFVVGHQSVAYPPDEKAIERAERDGYVWVPFLVPAAQPQGEPVAVFEIDHTGYRCKVVLDPSKPFPPNGAKLYAEQPAPVAVVQTCCGSCPGGCTISNNP